MKKVLVAGGGIIGLTTAYYLAEEGHDVTIIDKYDFLTNCSTGNAGLIVPSHFVPMASPGIVWQGIKWIFNPSSPFSMNFKFDLDLLKWSMSFWAHSNAKHVESSASTLLNFNLLSKKLYRNLALTIPQIALKEKGLLMLCQSEDKLEEEFKLAKKATSLGLDVQKLDKEALQKIEPDTKLNASGGVLYKNDGHLSPEDLTRGLLDLLHKKENVTLLYHTELLELIGNGNKITSIRTNTGKIKFDELVIATGVLSQPLFKQLEIRAKIQAGKGYSFVQNTPSTLKLPAILVDARVAVTPYDQFTRFAGAMEIGGKQETIKQHKVEGMVNSIRSFYPDIKLPMPEPENTWTGLRPCSNDGLPFIGRIKKYTNVIIASGHSMMGVSLAPATAKVVEELVSGKKLSFNVQPFNPDR